MGVESVPHAEEGAARRPATTPTSATRAASRPNLPSADAALDFVMKAIETAGYRPGEDIALGARLRRHRVLQGRQLSSMKARARRARSREQVDYLAELVARYPDRLDRGRHGRGRLGGLEAADRALGDEVPAGRRRSVRHQRRRGSPRHRDAASPTRSWSRSTRSAR